MGGGGEIGTAGFSLEITGFACFSRIVMILNNFDFSFLYIMIEMFYRVNTAQWHS